VLNGELTVKRLKWENGLVLVAENSCYKPIFINANDDFHIWGVATNVLHRLGRGLNLTRRWRSCLESVSKYGSKKQRYAEFLLNFY
jgi:Peptidase S24-like